MENEDKVTGSVVRMPGFQPARTADDVAAALDGGSPGAVGGQHGERGSIRIVYGAGGSAGAVEAIAGADNSAVGQSNPDMDAPARAREGLSPKAEARALLSELEGVENTLDALEERKADIRKQLAKALAAIGPDPDDQKIVTPFGSASLSDGARRVKIIGPIPTFYLKTVPDEKKIGDALRAGEIVHGAELSNGGEKVVRVTWPKS
jgi:hypothetical protein